MRYFSKKQALRFGWQKVREHLWFFVLLSLCFGAIVFLFNAAQQATESAAPAVASLFALVNTVFQMLMGMGYIYVVLQVVRGNQPKLEDIPKPFPSFWKYLGASILYGLIVLGGTLLLIVPGIIWAIRFGQYRYLIVDKPELTINQAFKESKLMTKGIVGQLILFSLLIFMVNILGALLLFVGLLVTIPLSAIALGYVYNTLLARLEPVVVPTQISQV